MNNTEKNHYSPTFTNKHWANKDGLIALLRREGSRGVVRSPTGPVKWGQEKHLYRQPIENALSRFETKVAPLLLKLLAGDAFAPAERLIWSRWILCQFFRTPTFVLEQAGFEEDVLSLFPVFSHEFSWAEIQAKINAAVNDVMSFTESEQLIPFIILRDWIVLRPAPGEFFIKGDTPVVIRGALVDDKAIIVYPLSPTHCFVAIVLKDFPPQQILAGYQLKPGEANYYVSLVASCAEREIICHPDHCSNDLQALVGDVLGTSSRYLINSTIPHW